MLRFLSVYHFIMKLRHICVETFIYRISFKWKTGNMLFWNIEKSVRCLQNDKMHKLAN